MATRPAKPATTEDVVAGLRRRRRHLVDAYMGALVPGYERSMDRRLGDMREAADRTIDLLLLALAEQRPITREEMDFTRSYLRHGMLRGASHDELLRSARVWQGIVLDALHDVGGPEGGALVAQLSRLLVDHVEAMSDAVAEIVAELERALSLTAREGRRELLEDLLAGRQVAPGAKLEAARACGLDEATAVLVVSARAVEPLPDPAAGSVAAVTLSHAAHDAVEPLFAVRDEEIVIVRATPDDPQRFVDALDHARARLVKDGVALSVGVSAVHEGRGSVPAAYDEACLARERVAEEGGLLALAILSALDYLFVRGADRTAWRLVPPAIRQFVENDLAQAGLLVDTLMAYIDSSLSVKLAAEKLFVHVNTAHYRLAKIEELTGCNLRDLADLQELVVAVRLARGAID